ncbi:MAG: valine--tRNA ligase [Marinilabiliales bacterium]|nr:MAG: valine--tRNA ligase [Marinilabiliales bacterium]
MDIPSKYNPAVTEEKWYKYWLDNGLFRSVPDERQPYTIVIPPPNVTGVLHMGHMLNNTIQDILVRRARMQGKNACWVPGTDHASIATEARVVARLKDKGIDKSKLSRKEFLEHAWAWKEEHGGIILEQLKKLGASCDWSRTVFTMDEGYSESVFDVFTDLYKKGLIYRGVRMVNWDPQAKTAVSDEEVIYREVSSKLYHVRYRVEGGDEWVVIATTRPETILGDTAVSVNPADDRFRHLHGKNVVVPMVNRVVPLITDSYVDMEFGTGALKITPAHDINDYEIGIRHNLPVIDIFNDDGTLGEKAEIFIGMDRFEARDAAVKKLTGEGYMVKVEDYVNKVGYSERTDAAIEPRLSMQWFCRMGELAGPALENVMNDNIRFYPAKFRNTYRHWMENIKDWCISRQLWWGHRIPAWYIAGGNDFVVAKTPDEALRLAREKTGNDSLTLQDIRQDEDVLDTWFSSWLWPVAVFDGIRKPDNPDYKYYYPTDDLVTAPEILFFWVARMIMAGYEYPKEKPFRSVYLTGIVRDKLGRKMSKSLGNSPEPLELIKKFGADGVRVGMLLCSPAGGDLLFDESLTGQGRNFSNKIWNAFRLVKGWETDENAAQPLHSQQAVEWFDTRLTEAVGRLERLYETYRLSEALMLLYRLFWDDFSSWYLEIVKPAYRQPLDAETRKATTRFFDRLLRLLHPIMPFITEELWQRLEKRKEGESIVTAQMPGTGKVQKKLLSDFSIAMEVVSSLRNIRAEKNIPQKEPLSLQVLSGEKMGMPPFEQVIARLANLSEISETEYESPGAISFMVGTTAFFVPMEGKLDPEEEMAKLQKELEYARGFLNSVMKKLDNERFVKNAPDKVVKNEMAKKSDAESRITALEERLNSLKA